LSIGIITLSEEGTVIARTLATALPDVEVYVHQSILLEFAEVKRFDHIVKLTRRIFPVHQGLIFIAPCGVAVRAVAPCIHKKKSDPAVVVVDVGGRFAVSLLSGHEGGANRLAVEVASIIGAEPVISTTTEAKKTLIVGIGCRKNVLRNEIIGAVISVLEEKGLLLEDVRLLATADLKKTEAGLIEASNTLDVPLVFISSENIRTFGNAFQKSRVVERNVGLPAVAEPCCMLAGRNTKLIVGKTKCNNITIAVARENCLWSV
jgi:cobalt-precorrin 5A hydrolase